MTAILSIPSILQKSLFLDLFKEDIITGSSLAVLRMPPEDVKKIGDQEITGAPSQFQCRPLEMRLIDNTL